VKEEAQMTFDCTISDLRQRPEFFDVVADRIWRGWWESRGFPLSYISGRLQENMSAEPIPFALIAHEGSTFLGTSSVIASDLEDLPQYTPWVAAVWVDPEYRERQVGRELVARAVNDVFALGIDRVYLCAPAPRRNFYLRQGWAPIEENVGTRGVTVFTQERPASAISRG
jgi:N-acetylglutamate synthase-like GNAT family acetyltransferase